MGSDFTEMGSVTVEHNGEETPPLSVSFCKTSKYSHILAVSDEDGYVSMFDTRTEFPSGQLVFLFSMLLIHVILIN